MKRAKWLNVLKARDTMKEEKYYRIELTAYGKKETTGFDGFDEANAFFSTDAKPATAEFIKATEKAIDKTFEQQSRYWLDYTIGKLFVQDGWEKVSPMSPAWEYRTASTMSHAVWKEVGKEERPSEPPYDLSVL